MAARHHPRRSVVPEDVREAAKAQLRREVRALAAKPIEGCAILRRPEDQLRLRLALRGRPGSAYEGGTFVIELRMSEDYPAWPPEVQVCTPTFHYNVDERGGICRWPLIQDPIPPRAPS